MRDFGPLLGVLAFIAVLIFGTMTLVSSNNETQRERLQSGYYLPEGATDINNIGKNWQEFTYKGQRFLYHRRGGDGSYQCLVRIAAEKPEKRLDEVDSNHLR